MRRITTLTFCRWQPLRWTNTAGDPCEQFKPKGDEVLSDKDFNMIAKMHKAISIMQWKMEGQIIKRRPEFRMENRLLL